MFAVIRTGGKQYKVAKDDVISVEKLAGEPGATIEFGEVLMIGDGAEVATGTPLVDGRLGQRRPRRADAAPPRSSSSRRSGGTITGARRGIASTRPCCGSPRSDAGGSAAASEEQSRWHIRKQAAPRATGATAPAGGSASRNSAARSSFPATSSCASAAPSFIPATHVGIGRDHTLFATSKAAVQFHTGIGGRTYISVVPLRQPPPAEAAE